ncbi:MAG: DUF3592 domain-containing protein [Lachnospiraceae bacterium]|nr:DUF3592 domain-containing protein [Lachnospiraceae bacterium]
MPIHYLLALVALILIARLLIFLYKSFDKTFCVEETEACLIYVDERSEYDPSQKKMTPYYVPIYEHKAGGTVFHSQTMEFSKDPAEFVVNTIHKVRYDPRKMSRCYIDGKKAKVLMSYPEGSVNE